MFKKKMFVEFSFILHIGIDRPTINQSDQSKEFRFTADSKIFLAFNLRWSITLYIVFASLHQTYSNYRTEYTMMLTISCSWAQYNIIRYCPMIFFSMCTKDSWDSSTVHETTIYNVVTRLKTTPYDWILTGWGQNGWLTRTTINRESTLIDFPWKKNPTNVHAFSTFKTSQTSWEAS